MAKKAQKFEVASGLPLGWTDPQVGRVSPSILDHMLPRNKALPPVMLRHENSPWSVALRQAVRRMGCISLFTGVAGLEVGLREPLWLVGALVKVFLPHTLRFAPFVYFFESVPSLFGSKLTTL